MSRQTERAEFRKAVKRGAGVAKQRKRAKAKAQLQARIGGRVKEVRS